MGIRKFIIFNVNVDTLCVLYLEIQLRYEIILNWLIQLVEKNGVKN